MGTGSRTVRRVLDDAKNASHGRVEAGTVLVAMTQKFDVAVLGGGAAGLSGAVVLGRGGRSVVVSQAALDRAARQAAKAGVDATWLQADVTAWDPAPRFDLVSAQYVQLPRPARDTLYRRLAAAVRPGGTLLIVGHHPADLEVAALRRPRLPHLMFTAEEIAAALDPSAWDIAVSAPERLAEGPDGQQITLTDAVLRAVRRAPDRSA